VAQGAAKIIDDLDVLLAFDDYPAEHWIHLRTTNPIESTFGTVRLRTRVTEGRAPEQRHRDGVQAHRVRPGPLAGRERTPPGRAGSVPAPGSRMASWSNDPTNQEVISKPRDTPLHSWSPVGMASSHTGQPRPYARDPPRSDGNERARPVRQD
jgi:hypothetical protein